MSPPTHVGVSTLVGLLFGLAGMGSAAVAVLPAIGADLDVSTGGGAWAISLYALMLAVATPVYGRVSDLVGHPAPLLVGVVPDDAGASRCAGAQLRVLLAARIVQGAGAAAVPTLAWRSSPPASRRSARGGPRPRRRLRRRRRCLGPLAGGAIEGLVGWRAVIALPMLGALMSPLLWRWVPTEGTGARLDLFGAVLVAATAAGVVLLVQSPSTGPVVAVVGAGLAVLGVPAVAAWVRRRPHGFLPVDVIRNPVVVRSALAAGAVPAAWFALLIAVPAVLVGRGWEPWQVGVALIPSAVTGLLAPRLASPLLNRIGPSPCTRPRGARGRRGARVSALGAHTGSAVLLVVCRRGGDLRVRAGPAGADGGRRRRRRRRRTRRRARHRDPVLPRRRRSRFGRRGRSRRRAGHAPALLLLAAAAGARRAGTRADARADRTRA